MIEVTAAFVNQPRAPVVNSAAVEVYYRPFFADDRANRPKPEIFRRRCWLSGEPGRHRHVGSSAIRNGHSIKSTYLVDAGCGCHAYRIHEGGIARSVAQIPVSMAK
jgi:hypothetical protein